MRNVILTLLIAWTATGVNAQTGSWKGSLDIQGLKLPLVFHFASDGCTVDSPSQGVKGVKAEKTAADDRTVKVTIPTISPEVLDLIVTWIPTVQ